MRDDPPIPPFVPLVLRTAHGRVLSLDGGSDPVLGQAAIGEADGADLVLLMALAPGRGLLVAGSGRRFAPAADAGAGGMRAVWPVAIETEGEEAVALRLDSGFLLTALEGGAVAADRVASGGWERFTPVRRAADGGAMPRPLALLDGLDPGDAGSVLSLCRRDGRPDGLAAALLALVPEALRLAVLRAAPERDRASLFETIRALRTRGGPPRPAWRLRDRLAGGIAAHGWTIGEHSYGAPEIIDGEHGTLAIGRYCAIAGGVRIVVANHLVRALTAYPFRSLDAYWPSAASAAASDHEGQGVRIGHGVWIGAGATILPGARIGDGAIVGAASVVAGVVPPYAVATGNPMRIARLRYEAPVVARLLAVAWWDWPDHRVDAAIGRLLGEDVEAFLRWAESGAGASGGDVAGAEGSP